MIALNRCPPGWVERSLQQRHSPRSAGTCSPLQGVRTNKSSVDPGLAMTLLGLVAIGGPAQAKVPGPNGQIVFSRFNPDTETADIFVANPEGTHPHEVPLPIPAEGFGGAFWSPDGTKLLITNLIQFDDNGELLPFRPATVNPDGSDFRVLEPPGAPFDMFC